MRILVDGLDLTGKTTLVHALTTALTGRGIPTRSHTWMLARRHPFAAALRRLPRVRQPDSGLITAALLGPGFVLDGLLVRWAPPDRPGEVIIQDGYADRCAAFGMAGGPHLAACLALRWRRLFAPFDIAIYLHEESELRALSGREGRQLGRCHAGAYLGLLRRRQPEVGTSMTGGRARLRRGVPRRRAGQGRRR
ncbi:thymidylate kinase [Nonomuraea angiospora]|uniref:Thymidylate kinase n=1 Tax=Nonomuraea angiospora TaxID=46172 RepID=A0ABR9LWC3_9ACTN|nr:hypothetical protein [Nonomuraea angiospora]MBE1584351.1 thymidylate kinase [Nonomuraea angiospora]